MTGAGRHAQAGVWQRPETHRDIHALLDQVHDPVEEHDRGRQARMFGEHVAHGRREHRPPEGDRCGDPQVTPRRHRLAHGVALGRLELGEHAPAALNDAPARVRDGQAARGAVEDTGPEAGLQGGDHPADGGRRQAKPGRRPGEAAGVGDGDDHLELTHPVHRFRSRTSAFQNGRIPAARERHDLGCQNAGRGRRRDRDDHPP